MTIIPNQAQHLQPFEKPEISLLLQPNQSKPSKTQINLQPNKAFLHTHRDRERERVTHHLLLLINKPNSIRPIPNQRNQHHNTTISNKDQNFIPRMCRFTNSLNQREVKGFILNRLGPPPPASTSASPAAIAGGDSGGN